MKKTFLAAFSALMLTSLLTACGKAESSVITEAPEGSAPVQTTETAISQEAVPESTAAAEGTEAAAPSLAAEEVTEALSYDAYQVVYNLTETAESESAVFQGIGPDHEMVWSYEVTVQGRGQMPGIIPAGSFRDTYYLIADGVITALDITNGQVKFENRDFQGAPCDEAILMDDYGYLYLSGFLGPDFFAMDPEGRTVKKIDDLSEEYFWPSRMELTGEQIIVYMSGSDNGGSGDFPCYIDIDWLPEARG